MSPQSSATGMNSFGGTTPSSPFSQRKSASAPPTSSSFEVDFGLIVERQFIGVDRSAQLFLE